MSADSPPPRPLIVPIFIPHAGCPHRCAFCDQSALTHTPPDLPGADAVAARVRTFRAGSRPERHPVQIAFYGGNFLGLPGDTVRSLLGAALGPIRRGEVDSIRFSTRPDTIDDARLALLEGFPVRDVELGAQSMDDRVLALSRRGHTAAQTREAAALVKDRGYNLGIQMMVGLPGDDPAVTAATGRAVADLGPSFVRIYPAVVLRGSPLDRRYRAGDYVPPTLADCVERAAALRLLFEGRGIDVIRTGLQASADLAPGAAVAAGPYHPAFGHLVLSKIFFDLAMAAGREWREARGGLGIARGERRGEVLVKTHPRRVNALRGMGNENLRVLERELGVRSVQVAGDPALGLWGLVLSDGSGRTILRRAVESPSPESSTGG
jgi:histone acetyltransferase (RNA polymerase elongator complex component)